MKKLTAVILLLALCLTLGAKDIAVDGTGATREEAKANAQLELSVYVNGAFVSSGVFYEAHESDGKAGESSSYSSSLVTSGYLKAVEYSYTEDGGRYVCTAAIRDTDTNRKLFVGELKGLNSTITTLSASLGKQSDKVKKNTLVSLYGALTEYEGYRNILAHMGHTEEVPELTANISATSVYTEYENIVIAEGYALEERERFITDEAEHEKLLAELSANRSEQRRLEREKTGAIKAKEEAARKALEAKLLQSYTMAMGNAPTIQTTCTGVYDSLRGSAEGLRENFLKACEEYDRLCREQFALIEKDYEAEKKAVEARPYRFAELQGGKPTDAAKSIRDQELDYLYMEKEMHKVSVFKQIREALLGPIQLRYENYAAALALLEGQQFEFVLASSSLVNPTVSYDATKATWTVKTKVAGISGLEGATFSFTLSYKDLTGKNTVEAKYRGQEGYDLYMEYLDEVDYLEELMRNFTKNFRVTLRLNTYVMRSSSGIGFDGIGFKNISFILESNSIAGNVDYAIMKTVTPNSVAGPKEYSWVLPGYTKTFDKEFAE